MELVNPVQNLKEAVCVSLCTHVVRKGMNQSLLPPNK